MNVAACQVTRCSITGQISGHLWRGCVVSLLQEGDCGVHNGL
jgi:hypothetical protein